MDRDDIASKFRHPPATTGKQINRPWLCALTAVPAVLAPLVLGSLGLAFPALAESPCRSTAIGTGTVAAVRDGRTLTLTDGRVVRLAGVEVPGSAREALQKLAAGQTLRLERVGPGADRYGRVVAFAFLQNSGQSLQETLLEEGEALVSARTGEKACTDLLLASERAAARAERGHWATAASETTGTTPADPNFAPLSSEELTQLEALRGHFARVEGKVLSVRESGATIYMNFGRYWTRGFAVTVLKKRQRSFAAAGIDLKQLEGRRIRVRGWIEQRRGPIIDATEPGQIELID